MNQTALYETFGLTAIAPIINEGSLERFSLETRQAYVFTTENILRYMELLDWEDKNVACVAGSGDFVINAFMAGARAVDAVDIAPTACLMTELKIAALAHLSYEEFLAFFVTTGPSSFSADVYHRLRPKLSLLAQGFFDQVIGKPEYISSLIIVKVDDMKLLKQWNPYLGSSKCFEAAKRALKPFLLYPQDMCQFLQSSQKRYDVVYLSNILSYPPFSRSHAEIDLVLQSAIDMLVEGGVIISYFFIPWNVRSYAIKAIQQRWTLKGYQTEHIIGDNPFCKYSCFFVLLIYK